MKVDNANTDVKRDLLDIKLRKNLQDQCMFSYAEVESIIRWKHTIYFELKKHFIERDAISNEVQA